MMRFWFWLVLLLATAIALALFPEVAAQTMTIEVMGWHLEMRQGLFLALAVVLLLLLRLLSWLLLTLARGPRQLIEAWRHGGRRRLEGRLRKALTAWVNGKSASGKPFQEATTILPTWLGDALAALVEPAAGQHENETALTVALRGKALAESTDEGVSPAIRREAVARWLDRFPASTPARLHALSMAEEAADWEEVIALIDQTPRGSVIPGANRRKAHALLQLAKARPNNTLELLRQAARLDDSDDVVIALAAAHRDSDDLKSARSVLLDALDRRDSLAIAGALADQEAAQDNPLLVLHMLDKRCRKQANVAQRWLLVALSRQAEDRDRVQHHLRLLRQTPRGAALAWEIEAEQHFEQGDWESAARCYHQAAQQRRGETTT